MNIISVTIHYNQPLASYFFFFNSNNDCIRSFPLLVSLISALNSSARVSLFTVLFDVMADNRHSLASCRRSRTRNLGRCRGAGLLNRALVEKHFSTWLVTFNQQIIFRAIHCFYFATLIVILYNIHAVYYSFRQSLDPFRYISNIH